MPGLWVTPLPGTGTRAGAQSGGGARHYQGASVAGLAGVSWLAPASGTLPVKLAIQVPWLGSRFSLKASSTLEGVEVKAPDPIGKVARTNCALVGGDRDEVGAPGQLALRYGDEIPGLFRLGDGLAGEVLLGGGHLQILQRALMSGEPCARGAVSPWLDFIGDQMAPALKQQGEGSRGVNRRAVEQHQCPDRRTGSVRGGSAQCGLFCVAQRPESGWDIAFEQQGGGGFHAHPGWVLGTEESSPCRRRCPASI